MPSIYKNAEDLPDGTGVKLIGLDADDNAVLVEGVDELIAASDAAVSAASTATTQAGLAADARTGAETAEANAEAAQAAAEAAADNATINADTYDDTADGFAATTVGDQFVVTVGLENVRYRHDAGPVATEVNRYPTAALTAAMGGIDTNLLFSAGRVQTIGRKPGFTPVTGTALGNITFVFGRGAVRDSYIRRFRAYSNAGSTLSIKVFSKSGNTYTQVGSDVAVTLASGVNNIDLGVAKQIAITAGNYVGFHCANVTYVVGAAEGGGHYFSGTGNVSSFTTTTRVSNARIQIGFDLVAVSDDYSEGIGATTDTAAAMLAAMPSRRVQTIGQSTVAASSGTGLSYTFAFAASPVLEDGFIRTMRATGVADGSIRVRIGDIVSGVWTAFTDLSVAIVTGDNEIEFSPAIPVAAGKYIGVYGYPYLGANLATGDSALYSAPSTGDVTSFIVGSATSGARWEIGFDIYAPDVASSDTASASPDSYRAVGAAPQALRLDADWSGMAGYGQSNRMAAYATPIINSTPSSYHLTFNVGPKMTKPGISGGGNDDDGNIKGLVEDTVNPATGASGSLFGETATSSFARGFSTLAAGNRNVPIWFASAAGLSGAKLSAIGANSAWYPNLTYHVSAAKAAADAEGKTYALSHVQMDHGESDQAEDTPKATYLTGLLELLDRFPRDVRAITGQTFDPLWFFTSSPYAIRRNDGPSDAILELCATRADCIYVVPGYRFQHYSDGLHFTALSQVIKGRYYARAAWQASLGLSPGRVWWLGATAAGTTLTVRAAAPTALAVNTTIVGAVTDYGFKVVDGTGTLTLSGITVGSAVLNPRNGLYETPITMTLNRSLGTNPVLRYAKDAIGSFPVIGIVSGYEGATGNIFDTTTDTVTISGTPYSLAHPAPPVTLPIFVDE